MSATAVAPSVPAGSESVRVKTPRTSESISPSQPYILSMGSPSSFSPKNHILQLDSFPPTPLLIQDVAVVLESMKVPTKSLRPTDMGYAV